MKINKILVIILALALVIPVTAVFSAADSVGVGDIDGNGIVDGADYIAIKGNVGGDVELERGEQTLADVNGDGVVSSADAITVLAAVRGEVVLPTHAYDDDADMLCNICNFYRGTETVDTTAPVVPEDTTAPETDAPVVPDAEVSLKISVWTKNGDWVSADELAAIKAGFEAYLTANGYDISKLNIVWSETTSENNKVAELGAIVNAAGDFDIIVGCGNNVNSTAGVSIIEKADILTSIVAAGRKVATLTDNELATALYTYLTTEAPVTDAPETSVPETSVPETTAPTEPGTGDNSLAIVLAIVAVAAIGCVAINLRKREEN